VRGQGSNKERDLTTWSRKRILKGHESHDLERARETKDGFFCKRWKRPDICGKKGINWKCSGENDALFSHRKREEERKLGLIIPIRTGQLITKKVEGIDSKGKRNLNIGWSGKEGKTIMSF